MNWVWFWTIYEWPTVSWMNVLSFTNSNTKMYLRIRYYSYKTSNTKMCICIRYYSYKTSIKLSQRYQTTFFFTLQWYQTTQISLTRKKREKKKFWPYCASTIIKLYLLKMCVRMVSIHHLYMDSSILLISERNSIAFDQVTRKTNWK